MRAAKTDMNHAEIRDGLRALGVFVVDTHAAAKYVPGFPDLLAWTRKVGWQLLEVKTATGTLTDAEEQFHDVCPGPVWIVRTLEGAARIMGLEVSDG